MDLELAFMKPLLKKKIHLKYLCYRRWTLHCMCINARHLDGILGYACSAWHALETTSFVPGCTDLIFSSKSLLIISRLHSYFISMKGDLWPEHLALVEPHAGGPL